MLVASVENNLNHFLSILEFTFHSFHYSFSIFSRRWCCFYLLCWNSDETSCSRNRRQTWNHQAKGILNTESAAHNDFDQLNWSWLQISSVSTGPCRWVMKGFFWKQIVSEHLRYFVVGQICKLVLGNHTSWKSSTNQQLTTRKLWQLQQVPNSPKLSKNLYLFSRLGL